MCACVCADRRWVALCLHCDGETVTWASAGSLFLRRGRGYGCCTAGLRRHLQERRVNQSKYQDIYVHALVSGSSKNGLWSILAQVCTNTSLQYLVKPLNIVGTLWQGAADTIGWLRGVAEGQFAGRWGQALLVTGWSWTSPWQGLLPVMDQLPVPDRHKERERQ